MSKFISMEEFEDRFYATSLLTETRGFKETVLSDPKYRRSNEVTVAFHINEKGQKVLDSRWGLGALAEMCAGADKYNEDIIILEELEDEEEDTPVQGAFTFSVLQDKTEIDEQAIWDILYFQSSQEAKFKSEQAFLKEQQRLEVLKKTYYAVKSQVTFEEFCKNFKQ